MNIKSQLGRSTAWMSLAASGNSAISFVIFIVLSRLLAPAEIGLVAFALIIVELGKIVVTGGFSQAVVQKSDWDNTYASTCFHLNLIFSLAITLIVIFIIAPLVGHYYQAQAGPILTVLSIIFFLEGVKAVHEGKLKREFAFKIIAIRTILAGLLPGALGIFLAYKGYGVWALVAQQILNQIVITILTLATAKWMPSLTFSKSFAQQILSFSSPLMFAQLISNISSKLFEFMIGIFIGPAALGFYRVGGRAIYILQDVAHKPFEHTALSALARIEGTENQANATLRMIRISAFLTFPLFLGAAGIAQQFIVFAFGEKWATSGELMAILSFGIALFVIGIHVNAVLTATGRSKMVMAIAIVSFVINCGLGLLCVPYGLIFAAWGYTLRGVLINAMCLYWLKKALHLPLLSVPKAIAPSLIASSLMFLAIHFSDKFVTNNLAPIIAIVVLCIIGALTYIIVMLTIFKSATGLLLTEAVDMAPQKFKRYLIFVRDRLKLTQH